MKSILVGIDGSERSQCALEWAAALAHEEQAQLALLAIIDPGSDRLAGADSKILQTAVDNVLGTAQAQVAVNYPDIEVSVSVGKGDIVESLIAASEDHDIIVLGSHHNASVGEKIFGAKGLRVASSTSVATAVVPSGWKQEGSNAHGIVVGVGPDDTSNDAVVLGAALAEALGEPLELVSAWGIPTLIARSAEAMGGGLEPVGEQFQRKLDSFVEQIKQAHPSIEVTGKAVEGASPTQVVLEHAHGKRMLLLGTHERSRVSRALFGSVTFGVLSRLEVPTIVVPEKQ